MLCYHVTMPFGYVSMYVPKEQYCYRCGNPLGGGRSMLVRARRYSWPVWVLNNLYIWVKNLYLLRFGNADWRCRRCGVDTEREWREDVLGYQPHNPLKGPTLKPVRHTIDEADSGLPDVLRRASFPVYGLTGQPLGLVMRSVSWDTAGLRPAVEGIGLLYDTGAGQRPRRRLLIQQAVGEKAIARMRSPAQELRAVIEVVQEHGARGQRDRFADRGNVFRHWNLARLSEARRRNVVVRVGDAPVEVEIAQWSDPQQVVVTRLSMEGSALMAAAVDIPPVRLLEMLKGLAPLGRDEGPWPRRA